MKEARRAVEDLWRKVQKDAPEGKRWRRVKGRDGKTVILETRRKAKKPQLIGYAGRGGKGVRRKSA